LNQWSEAAAAKQQAHEHGHDEGPKLENPRWWLDAERRAAFFDKLRTGAALVLLLAMPFWGRVARLGR